MKSRIFKRVLLIALLIALSFAIIKVHKYQKFYAALDMKKSLEIENLKDEIKEKDDKFDELSKDTVIKNEDYEAYAREELGLIKKDEIVIKPR